MLLHRHTVTQVSENHSHTPLNATCIAVAMILILPLAFPLELLADLAAQGTLVAFAGFNLAPIRNKNPPRLRPAKRVSLSFVGSLRGSSYSHSAACGQLGLIQSDRCQALTPASPNALAGHPRVVFPTGSLDLMPSTIAPDLLDTLDSVDCLPGIRTPRQ